VGLNYYYAKKCDVEVWADAMNDAANQIVPLKAAFRVNMLRLMPEKTHAEIDAEIEKIINNG
jgi:hypothetical protein